jgi:sugar phosphate isomerase/epimerase
MHAPSFSRRNFLAAATVALCPLGLRNIAATIDPFQRTRPSHLKLSIAAYSYRDLLDFKNPKLDMFGFVDLAADLALDAVEPTSYWFPEGFDDAYLRRLQQYAFLRGLDISGTAIRNDFCLAPGPKLDDELKQVSHWIDRASVLGAPVMRVFGGNVPVGENETAVVKRAVGNIESLLPQAVEKGVLLALENHGGITETPDQLLRIVQAVEAPNGGFGVNLDTGNFHGDDPYADIARLAPYAVNVQVKTEISRRRKPKEVAELSTIVQILREAKYSGYVVLEYEAAANPFEAIPEIVAQLRTLIRSDA